MADLTKTMRSHLEQILKEQILSGRYLPGQRIREDELTNTLDVSRTPIREAFLVLEQEGLIEIKPHRGVFVATFNPEQIIELLRLESVIEGLAASLAAESASEPQIKKLERLTSESEKKLADHFQSDIFYSYDRDFHHLLITCSGSAKIIRVLERQLSQIYLCRYYTYSAPNRFFHSINEHKKIVEYIRKRNPILAERATRDHLESVITDFINSTKKGVESTA